MLFLLGWLVGSVLDVALVIATKHTPPPLLLPLLIGAIFHIAKVSRDTIKDSNNGTEDHHR